MKKLFVIGTVVVLVCSMWVSVNHTLALFRAGKFTNGLEVPATIAAETAFIMGLLSIFDARRKGTSPPWQAKMLFMLGLIVVGWSNVGAGIGYAWSGVWTAVILGVLIPVFIFGAEAVLTHAYFESAKRKRRADDPAQLGAAQLGEIRVGAARANEPSQSAQWAEVSQMTTPAQVDAPAQSEASQAGAAHEEPAAQWDEDARPQIAPAQREATAQMGAPEIAVGGTGEEAAAQKSGVAHDATPAHEEAAQAEVTAQEVAAQTTAQSETPAQESAQVGDAQKEPAQKRTGGSQKKAGDTHEDEIAFAIECARDYLRDKGKLPSRRKLAEIADCSEWIARKALQQLQIAS